MARRSILPKPEVRSTRMVSRTFPEGSTVKRMATADSTTPCSLAHCGNWGTLADTTREIDATTAGGVLDLVLVLREKARSGKDYATSDLIRNELEKLSIKVMDIKGGGATWERG